MCLIMTYTRWREDRIPGLAAGRVGRGGPRAAGGDRAPEAPVPRRLGGWPAGMGDRGESPIPAGGEAGGRGGPGGGERRGVSDGVGEVPGLVCFYGEGEALPDPVLPAARDALGEHSRPELGEPLCTAGLCLYRDGRDSVAWHGDTIGRG